MQFSRDDLAEIRIDSRLKRKAHQVLAFCRLYWLKINDPDFERKIFLYSKKYNTKHYDIFRTIKEGRLRALPDDVLLLEVFNHLSRGYEYNISEDLYMRKAWQRIKPVPVSAPAGVVRRGPGTADSGSSGKASAAGRVRETASAGRGAPPKGEQAKPVSVTAGSGGPSGKKPPRRTGKSRRYGSGSPGSGRRLRKSPRNSRSRKGPKRP